MHIRKFENKDIIAVREICHATADKSLRENKRAVKLILRLFCNYYIEQEPENCFVVVDEQDDVIGYILCARNYNEWKTRFSEQYLKIYHPLARLIGKSTIRSFQKYGTEYPAHLHINMRPGYEGQGIGTRLMDTLITHLLATNIHGLALGVSTNNKRGQKFYQKYGFHILEKKKWDVIMGIHF